MHIPTYPAQILPRILMQLLLLAGVATTAAVGPLRAEDSKPTNIGSRLELFVDDALIDHQRNLTLQLHEPAIAETVMTWDFPWEGSNNGYITIFNGRFLIKNQLIQIRFRTDVMCIVLRSEIMPSIFKIL